MFKYVLDVTCKVYQIFTTSQRHLSRCSMQVYQIFTTSHLFIGMMFYHICAYQIINDI